jgi:thioredoxin 1
MEYAVRVSENKNSTLLEHVDVVVEVTSADQRKEILSNNKYVVIKLGAEWCGPCKRIAAEYHDIAVEFKDNCVFLIEDIDNDFGGHPEVSTIPAFHFYKDGTYVDQSIGANMITFSSKLSDLLNENKISEENQIKE